MPRRPELLPTSRALLGLLANRPFSAYDLTRQTLRTIRLVWRSAESHLYAELKKLDADGLVRSWTEHHGRRARAEYEITPAGRAAVADWLRAPHGTEPTLEFEALLQVLFAEHGSIEDLRRTLGAIEASAISMRAVGAMAAAEYLDGRGEFPERTHVNVLTWRYLADLYEMTAEWARWAQAHVASWDDVAPTPERRDAALTVWRAAHTDPRVRHSGE